MNNIKCQNLVIFSFKLRMKHKFSLSINQVQRTNQQYQSKSIKKCQQYFHCFIVCILGPYAFRFRFQWNIVTILISIITIGLVQRCGAYQRGNLYQREALISMWITKGAALVREWRLFEARSLLEEIRYNKNTKAKKEK